MLCRLIVFAWLGILICKSTVVIVLCCHWMIHWLLVLIVLTSYRLDWVVVVSHLYQVGGRYDKIDVTNGGVFSVKLLLGCLLYKHLLAFSSTFYKYLVWHFGFKSYNLLGIIEGYQTILWFYGIKFYWLSYYFILFCPLPLYFNVLFCIPCIIQNPNCSPENWPLLYWIPQNYVSRSTMFLEFYFCSVLSLMT